MENNHSYANCYIRDCKDCYDYLHTIQKRHKHQEEDSNMTENQWFHSAIWVTNYNSIRARYYHNPVDSWCTQDFSLNPNKLDIETLWYNNTYLTGEAFQ